MRKLFILTLFLCFSPPAFSQSGFMKNVSDNFGKTSGCKSIKRQLFKTYKISVQKNPNLKINNLLTPKIVINFSKNFYLPLL